MRLVKPKDTHTHTGMSKEQAVWALFNGYRITHPSWKNTQYAQLTSDLLTIVYENGETISPVAFWKHFQATGDTWQLWRDS